MSRPTRAAALVLFALAGVAAGKPTTPQALALAQRYLAQWEETLVALVASEEYRQEIRVYRRYQSSGASQWLPPTMRRLTSDVLLVRAADESWLSFRDVMAVDGAAVRDRSNRFDNLFTTRAANVIATARRIADEGARYNLGSLHRTTNTPTAPLTFLQARYARNTNWDLDASARLDGTPVWILRFDQRKPPFVVTIQDGKPYPASGRFWLEPESGRIRQAELVVKGGAMTSTTRIRYGAVASVEAWVPVRMEDGYALDRGETVTGVATYSNHRLFRTSARIVGH